MKVATETETRTGTGTRTGNWPQPQQYLAVAIALCPRESEWLMQLKERDPRKDPSGLAAYLCYAQNASDKAQEVK